MAFTREWFVAWIHSYVNTQSELYGLLFIICVAFLVICYGLREVSKTRTYLEQRAEFMQSKYPPLTPEQQAVAEREMREWERSQFTRQSKGISK